MIQKASRNRRYGSVVHIENADHVSTSDDFTVSYVEVHRFHRSLISTLFFFVSFLRTVEDAGPYKIQKNP